MINRILSALSRVGEHKHKFETTHTNKWMHATRQKCNCGVTREFKYFDNKDEINGMPWEKGRWVHSDGEESEYTSKSRHN